MMAMIATRPAAITISLNQPIPMTPKMLTSEKTEETEASIINMPPMTATSKRPSRVSSM